MNCLNMIFPPKMGDAKKPLPFAERGFFKVLGKGINL